MICWKSSSIEKRLATCWGSKRVVRARKRGHRTRVVEKGDVRCDSPEEIVWPEKKSSFCSRRAKEERSREQTLKKKKEEKRN